MTILTITPNPALDLTGQLNELTSGTVNRIDRSIQLAAGKGVNVSRVLAGLGVTSTLTGWLGADNQQPFTDLIAQLGCNDQFIRLPGATRTNVKLAEAQGRVTDLNFPGITVSADAISLLLQQVDQLSPFITWCGVAGSLPPGVEPCFYKTLIQRLKAQGKRVIFDSSGQGFCQGVHGVPDLVKPNLAELCQWVDRPLNDDASIVQAARQLNALGIKQVLVSLGADGAIWVSHDQALKVVVPKVKVASCVGAGDTMVAAMLYGFDAQWPIERCLTFACAAAAVSVSGFGLNISPVAVETMAKQVQLLPLQL